MNVAKDQALETTFVERLSQARGVLVVYWLLVLGGLVAFTVFIVADDGIDELPELLALDIGAFVGVLMGQAFALMRLRTWVSWAIFGVCLFLMLSLSMWGGGAGEAFLLVFLAWFGWMSGLISGHASLNHRFGLAAAWVPILFWVGTIIGYLNEYGRVHQWEQNKVSAWLPIPLVLLFCCVGLLLAYLASKESHRLTLWQLLGSAPWRRTHVRRATPRVKMRARGWVTILLLTGMVFAITAIISPYLWRTGPGEEGDDPGGTKPQEQQPQDDWGNPDAEFWRKVGEAVEKAARGAKDAAESLLPFIPLFLLNRPIRRAWLLWRLRRPAWPVPPSRRIASLWEYVRIGLGDAGIPPRDSDSVEDVVERAGEAARKRGQGASEALRSAGDIYTRVRYGLGIRPGEVAALETAATRAFRDVRSGMSGWERFKSWFRKID